jgi:tetratricopeptide (TPR) repeat protein
MMKPMAGYWMLALAVIAASAPAADSPSLREDARLSNATSRCTNSAELIACYEALNMRPNDPDLLVAEGDALVQAKRPGEAVGVYRNALSVGADHAVVNSKIAVAASLRRSLVDTCLTQEGPAAEHACESAWLPGAADEVTLFKRRAQLLQSEDQPAAALDAYMAAARLRPKDRGVAHAIVSLSEVAGRKDTPATTALVKAKDLLRQAERGAGPRNAGLVAVAPAADVPSNRFSNDAEVTRSN